MSWIKINTFLNSYEADIAKSVLESHGIECRILNSYSAQLLAALGDYELWVQEQDAEKALNYLDEAEPEADQAL